MFLIENTFDILKKAKRKKKKKRAFGHAKNVFIKTNENSLEIIS